MICFQFEYPQQDEFRGNQNIEGHKTYDLVDFQIATLSIPNISRKNDHCQILSYLLIFNFRYHYILNAAAAIIHPSPDIIPCMP